MKRHARARIWAPALVILGGLPWSGGLRAEETAVGVQFQPLIERLQAVAADPHLQGARVGMQLVNVDTGATVFSLNPDLLINPASVSKIFTTAAALCLLHPDYRFKTELYTLGEPVNGVVKGPLYLKGYGDPMLVDERLYFLASELEAIGIRKIEGPILLDDTAIDAEELGPGWTQDSSSRPYQAPMGALSLNWNSIAVAVFPGEGVGRPARVELYPYSEHFRVVNRALTTANRTWIGVETQALGRQTEVVVRGRVSLHHKGSRHYARITSPTFYTGRTFQKNLKMVGIQIAPGLQRATVPPGADLLYTLLSPDLGELTRVVNKRSQNFMAEQLYKTLGGKLLGEPGSWWKGQQVLAAFLDEEVGIPPSSYVLHNGSGLNDTNRVSAAQVVALLSHMWKRFEVRADFLASLAVSGADGTLIGRFTHPSLMRTMRLKTGSLENTRSLAGYIHTQGDEVLGFAMLVSDFSCHGWEVGHLIDLAASAIAQADRNLLVVRQVEVAPLEVEEDPTLIAPAGPAEGNEEALAPKGEELKAVAPTSP